MPNEITSENFNKDVLECTGKLLVLFWVEWALPSVEMLMRLENLEGIPTASVDIEKYPDVAKAVDIRAAPTLVLFENGEYRGFKVGLISAIQAYTWANAL
jgi:thioredoxin-like negative regulator of GroEL